MSDLTAEEARKLFKYDPETGRLEIAVWLGKENHIASGGTDITKAMPDTRRADAILAALAEAGFELVDTKVTRPDWKGIACDMIGIHALERRRAYFHAAETLEPGYTVEAANEQ